jgi:hypothetical protein
VGPLEGAEWAVGPFPIHIVDPERVEIRWTGDAAVRLEESTSGLQVFGPWRVTIQGVPMEGERRVLSTWRVHWVRVAEPQVRKWWAALERQRVSAWYRREIVGGASEAHALAQGGASEAWRLGGSEEWTIGASEWMAMGGSEIGWLGASQLAMGGASAFLFGGASGWSFGGAGGWSFGGSSSYSSAGVWSFGGASERWSDEALRGAGTGKGH